MKQTDIPCNVCLTHKFQLEQDEGTNQKILRCECGQWAMLSREGLTFDKVPDKTVVRMLMMRIFEALK